MKLFISYSLLYVFTALVGADLIITQCNHELTGMINEAIHQEIPSMLHTTIQRLATYRQDILVPQGAPGAITYAKNSFAKLFKTLILAEAPTQAYASGVSSSGDRTVTYINRISHILTFLRGNIQALSSQSKNLQISCDPSWLNPKNVAGLLLGQYKDDREVGPDPDERPLVQIPGGRQTIEGFDRRSHDVLLIFNGLSPPYPSVILLNHHNLADWKPGSQEGSVNLARTFEFIKTASSHGLFKNLKPGTAKLDDLVSHSLASVLLWALFQTSTMMDDPGQSRGPLDDKTCGFGQQFAHPEFANQAEHGWLCITQLPTQSSDRAIRNPTTLQYFVVGAYLKNADWSLGVNRPLSSTRFNYRLSKGHSNEPWTYPNVPAAPNDPAHRPLESFEEGEAGASQQEGSQVTNPRRRPRPSSEENEPDLSEEATQAYAAEGSRRRRPAASALGLTGGGARFSGGYQPPGITRVGSGTQREDRSRLSSIAASLTGGTRQQANPRLGSISSSLTGGTQQQANPRSSYISSSLTGGTGPQADPGLLSTSSDTSGTRRRGFRFPSIPSFRGGTGQQAGSRSPLISSTRGSTEQQQAGTQLPSISGALQGPESPNGRELPPLRSSGTQRPPISDPLHNPEPQDSDLLPPTGDPGSSSSQQGGFGQPAHPQPSPASEQ